MQHFQVTLNDIELQMEQHSSHNGMLRQENVELADRLQKLIEQYELCEEVTYRNRAAATAGQAQRRVLIISW